MTFEVEMLHWEKYNDTCPVREIVFIKAPFFTTLYAGFFLSRKEVSGVHYYLIKGIREIRVVRLPRDISVFNIEDFDILLTHDRIIAPFEAEYGYLYGYLFMNRGDNKQIVCEKLTELLFKIKNFEDKKGNKYTYHSNGVKVENTDIKYILEQQFSLIK